MNGKPLSLLNIILSTCVAITLNGGHAAAAGASSPSTPCMAMLDRFTAADVPAMGPAEIASPAGKWTNAVTPAGLPGKGLAQHPMLYVGENYTKMFLVNDGKITWTYQTGPGYEYDDVWMLSNGNILFTRMQYVAEITPDKKEVWRYDCNNSKGTNHTEVHTCQPIGLDKVMFVLNGLPPRLMVINTKTGAVEINHEISYPSATNPGSIHGQFRRARYTSQGTYLLSYLGGGKVVELDKNFNEIWNYPIRSPWAALRLKNGNTLITAEPDGLAVGPGAAKLHPAGQRQHHPHFSRWRRQRSATRRSDPGQASHLGLARLAGPRRRHRRANPGRPGHPRKSGRLAALIKPKNHSCPPESARYFPGRGWFSGTRRHSRNRSPATAKACLPARQIGEY